MDFITEPESVYWAVRTEFTYLFSLIFSLNGVCWFQWDQYSVEGPVVLKHSEQALCFLRELCK
jgi:hypothetical protein